MEREGRGMVRSLPAEAELVELGDLVRLELAPALFVALDAAPGDEAAVLEGGRLQDRPLLRVALLVFLEGLEEAVPADLLHAPLESDLLERGGAVGGEVAGLVGAALQMTPQPQAVALGELLAGLRPAIRVLGAVELEVL